VSAPPVISISTTTRYCAVYGQPILHSASPAMQNAGMTALGLNWRYLAFQVDPNDLRTAIEGARAMGFLGLNLTVPHKLLAVEMMDALDETARAWGAVNTVRFEAQNQNGVWRPLREFTDTTGVKVRAHGFNTDADAITRSLREDLQVNPSGASVLLLGAGGAGRTAALKLASEKVGRLYLINRTASKAASVADEIRQRFPHVRTTLGYPGASDAVDLLINATSLGLNQADALPLDTTAFDLSKARAVYDMIYRPAETPLLRAARSAGCRLANGLSMLLYQGARALELWSGQEPPIEAMRLALHENVYGTRPNS
jgi:shikimate dehydrogenase